jgi:hypothetical protein
MVPPKNLVDGTPDGRSPLTTLMRGPIPKPWAEAIDVQAMRMAAKKTAARARRDIWGSPAYPVVFIGGCP